MALLPAVDDAETGQGPDLAADPVSLLGSGLLTSELSIGMFVFLRNARFDAANESTANPRYWLGRITAAGPTGGPSMVSSPMLSLLDLYFVLIDSLGRFLWAICCRGSQRGRGGMAGGFGRAVSPRDGMGHSPYGDNARDPTGMLSPDGKLRLQVLSILAIRVTGSCTTACFTCSVPCVSVAP